jgi:hypothetical protein
MKPTKAPNAENTDHAGHIGHGGQAGQGGQMDFAQIGAVFNDATSRLEGGVTVQNQAKILSDLALVQTNLANLIQQQPGLFTGESAIHAQNIVDQLNLETKAIHSLGTDPYAAKYINDVQRDLIDIVQGDDNLKALATQHGGNGFAAVPDPIAPPTPFHGSQAQTEFMQKFVVDAQSLGERAVALEKAGAAPGGAETMQLVKDIQTFDTAVDQFTVDQGGLYSARFNNEFAHDGVNGTASRALIHGLQTGNAGEVQAAANVLGANAADVSTNMLAFDQTPGPKVTGIPDKIDTFAQAGTVFNDATTKMIGGIYDGIANDGNRQAILNDLGATKTGLEGLLANKAGDFQGASAKHVQTIINDLAKEMTLVKDAGTGVMDTHKIGGLQKEIISIVQHDKALSALATADGATGFAALPSTQKHGGEMAGGRNNEGEHHGQDALAHDPAAHVFNGHDAHLFG